MTSSGAGAAIEAATNAKIARVDMNMVGQLARLIRSKNEKRGILKTQK